MSLPTWETDLFSLAPETPLLFPSVNTWGRGVSATPPGGGPGGPPICEVGNIRWEGPACLLAAPRPADVTFLFVFLEPGRANSC